MLQNLLNGEVLSLTWTISLLLGVQREYHVLGSAYEFKIKGNPFSSVTSADDAINARKLATTLLFLFYSKGLKLLVSSKLSQNFDLSTWIFHREVTPEQTLGFACIGISSSNKLQFIGFPPDILHILPDVIAKNWPQMTKKVKMEKDFLTVKLNGSPWLSEEGSDGIQARTLIKGLIKALDGHNWMLYGSSNVKNTADTIFFRYDHDETSPVDGSRIAGFVISLARKDCLQVIDSSAQVTACVREVLEEYWPHGVQQQYEDFNADVLQLHGNPWWSDGLDGVGARSVMCKLFERLASIGWLAQIAIDVTRITSDKSMFTFQSCLPMDVHIFCLSLHDTSKIRFINAPQDVQEALVEEIEKCYPPRIAKDEQFGNYYRQVQLMGDPWGCGMDGHDGTHGRVLLLHLLNRCASIGWFIIISADVSAKFVNGSLQLDYPADAHSWWFMHIKSTPPPCCMPPPLAPSPFAPTDDFSAGTDDIFVTNDVSGMEPPGCPPPC